MTTQAAKTKAIPNTPWPNEVSIYDVGGPTVKMSNAITYAAHGLNVDEKKLILVAISKILDLKESNDKSLLETANQEIMVTTADLARLSDDKPNAHQANADMRKAAGTLITKSIEFSTNEAYYGGEMVRTVNWVQEVAKPLGGNFILIKFSDRIFRNFTELDDGYTMFKLKAAFRLKGKHSLRLFELLMQWARKGVLIISRADFNHAMDLPPSYSKSEGQHRTKIIDPSINELKEKLGLKVKCSKTVNGFFEFKFERRLTEEEAAYKAARAKDKTPNFEMMRKRMASYAYELEKAGYTDTIKIAKQAKTQAQYNRPKESAQVKANND